MSGPSSSSSSASSAAPLIGFEQPASNVIATGHADEISALAVSPDGKPPQTLTPRHGGGVRSLAFNPDSTLLVSASDDKTVKLWEVADRVQVWTATGHTHRVFAALFAKDLETIISCSFDQTIRLWGRIDGRSIQTADTGSPCLCMCLTSAGIYLLTGHADRCIHIRRFPSLDLVKKIEGHAGPVYSIAISRKNQFVISSSVDQTCKVWSFPAAKLMHSFPVHVNSFNSISVHPINIDIFALPDRETVKIYQASTGTLLRTKILPAGQTGYLCAVCFSLADGQYFLMAAGETNNIFAFEQQPSPSSVRIQLLKEKMLAKGGSDLHVMQSWMMLWDAHRSHILALAVSPDGKFLASGCAGYFDTVKLWLFPGGRCERVLSQVRSSGPAGHAQDAPPTGPGNANWVRTLAFSPDGSLLVSGCDDAKVRVWSVAEGTLLRSLTGHRDVVRQVHVMQDSQTVISCSEDKTIRLWKMGDGSLIRSVDVGYCFSFVLTSDEQYLANACDDNCVHIGNYPSLELMKRLEGHTSFVYCVAISAGDQFVISGSYDETCKVWRFSTGELLHTLPGHAWCRHNVISVHPSAAVVAVADEKIIQLWHLETGELLETAMVANDHVFAHCFAPLAGEDGLHFVTAGADNNIAIYKDRWKDVGMDDMFGDMKSAD